MPHVDTGTARIWYDTAGDGARLVFIQGVGAVGAGWRAQTDALRDGHACAWIDNRGVGRSVPAGGSVDGAGGAVTAGAVTGPVTPGAVTGPLTIAAMAGDCAAVMADLGWDRAHVIGHSMGGLIAQQLAVDHPERVLSLVLISTFARGGDVGKPLWRALWMYLRGRVGTRRSRRQAACDMVFPRAWQQQVGLATAIAALEEVFGGDITVQSPMAMPQLRAARASDLYDRLGAVAAPSLVIGGRLDRIASPAQSELLAARIPGARLEMFEDAGHAVTIQRADEVNALIRDHVASAASR